MNEYEIKTKSFSIIIEAGTPEKAAKNFRKQYPWIKIESLNEVVV